MARLEFMCNERHGEKKKKSNAKMIRYVGATERDVSSFFKIVTHNGVQSYLES